MEPSGALCNALESLWSLPEPYVALWSPMALYGAHLGFEMAHQLDRMFLDQVNCWHSRICIDVMHQA